MEDDLIKQKLETLLQEMKFLEADLEFHKKVLQSAQKPFSLHYNDKSKKMGAVERIRKRIAKNRQGPPPAKNSKPRVSKTNKEIYKKIATVAHPDKLMSLSEKEKSEKEKQFIAASEAMSNNMMLTLYQIAKDVGVELPVPTIQDIQFFEEELKIKKKEILDLENNWIWHYACAQDDEQRDSIVGKYIYFLLYKS